MTAAALFDHLRRAGFAFDGTDSRLRVRPPDGRPLAPDEAERLRQHREVLLAILTGSEVEAGPDWRPKLGESFPALWADGRCVRCESRRWRWNAARQRWECANPHCQEGKGGS